MSLGDLDVESDVSMHSSLKQMIKNPEITENQKKKMKANHPKMLRFGILLVQLSLQYTLRRSTIVNSFK